MSPQCMAMKVTPGAIRSVTRPRIFRQPRRLVIDTISPSWMPRAAASSGWISRDGSGPAPELLPALRRAGELETGEAHPPPHFRDDLPVRPRDPGRVHDPLAVAHQPLAVGAGALFFTELRHRQQHVRVAGRLCGVVRV